MPWARNVKRCSLKFVSVPPHFRHALPLGCVKVGAIPQVTPWPQLSHLCVGHGDTPPVYLAGFAVNTQPVT